MRNINMTKDSLEKRLNIIALEAAAAPLFVLPWRKIVNILLKKSKVSMVLQDPVQIKW